MILLDLKQINKILNHNLNFYCKNVHYYDLVKIKNNTKLVYDSTVIRTFLSKLINKSINININIVYNNNYINVYKLYNDCNIENDTNIFLIENYNNIKIYLDRVLHFIKKSYNSYNKKHNNTFNVIFGIYNIFKIIHKYKINGNVININFNISSITTDKNKSRTFSNFKNIKDIITEKFKTLEKENGYIDYMMYETGIEYTLYLLFKLSENLYVLIDKTHLHVCKFNDIKKLLHTIDNTKFELFINKFINDIDKDKIIKTVKYVLAKCNHKQVYISF